VGKVSCQFLLVMVVLGRFLWGCDALLGVDPETVHETRYWFGVAAVVEVVMIPSQILEVTEAESMLYTETKALEKAREIHSYYDSTVVQEKAP
jgi:hypothetical protein